MSIRHLGLAVVGALAAPAVLLAQLPRSSGPVNRAPDKNATSIMISSFTSNDPNRFAKGTGPLAAEEMRRQVTRAFPSSQVYVIPAERMISGFADTQFPTDEALEPHDAKALAIMLRADEYVLGSIIRTEKAGYRTEADLVLTRDMTARQPLGVGEARKIEDAIKSLVKEMKEARKQMDGEKKCTNAARAGKYPDAIEFARAAMVQYPKATLARMCLLSVLEASKAPTAEVLKVARELVTLDPRRNVGLKCLANAHRRNNQNDSLVMALARMIRNEPRNSEFVNSAVSEITAKNPGLARPIIDSAIARTPGTPDLLKTRWMLLYAMKDWQEMRNQGAQLLRLDTTFADTTYFQRTAVSFAADSQWQQAASMAALGVAKFPTNGRLVYLEIDYLQRAGQP